MKGLSALRILRISRVVRDLNQAERFYRNALGFQVVAQESLNPAERIALGMEAFAAEQLVLRLGANEIALVNFTPSGRPYPAESRSNDLWFQHLAIVVRDMDEAYRHLRTHGAWEPISWGGPQELPPADGRVRAFKFRDPDGHPLELLWFPPGTGRAVAHHSATPSPFFGIDHSALAIALSGRSLAFYRRLGFHLIHKSWNSGGPQSALDGLLDARARVLALRPTADDGPGLELLRYMPAGRRMGEPRPNDALTDWTTVAVSGLPGPSPGALRDPDGHILLLVDQGAEGASTGLPARGPAT